MDKPNIITDPIYDAPKSEENLKGKVCIYTFETCVASGFCSQCNIRFNNLMGVHGEDKLHG